MLSWRSRKVKLEDANISQALGLCKEKEDALTASFKSFQDGSLSAKDFATAYEEVITARQDAAEGRLPLLSWAGLRRQAVVELGGQPGRQWQVLRLVG